MKSGAEPGTSRFCGESGLFDRVDYRLVETPEEKDEIYLMRYRAYLREGGLILPSESQRVSDRYDDAPNAWTFGIYLRRGTLQFPPPHVLTSEWRMSYRPNCSAMSFTRASTRARFSSIRPVSSPIPKKPSGFRNFPI